MSGNLSKVISKKIFDDNIVNYATTEVSKFYINFWELTHTKNEFIE